MMVKFGLIGQNLGAPPTVPRPLLKPTVWQGTAQRTTATSALWPSVADDVGGRLN